MNNLNGNLQLIQDLIDDVLEVTGVKLNRTQIQMFLTFIDDRFSKFFSDKRGCGKTVGVITYACYRCLGEPNTSVGIFYPSFALSRLHLAKNQLSDKVKEQIFRYTNSSERVYIEFKNGSFIESLPLGKKK
jgi:hypothetical protein